MRIGEAIRLLQQDVDDIEDILAAERLGIEALKRERLFRERVPKKEWLLLPGETPAPKEKAICTAQDNAE